MAVHGEGGRAGWPKKQSSLLCDAIMQWIRPTVALGHWTRWLGAQTSHARPATTTGAEQCKGAQRGLAEDFSRSEGLQVVLE